MMATRAIFLATEGMEFSTLRLKASQVYAPVYGNPSRLEGPGISFE